MRRLAFALALAGSGALAQPSQDATRPTVMETGSQIYHTDRFTLPGPEGGLDYVIELAWPRGEAPEGGFPAVYALDGRAAALTLDEDLLAALAEAGGVAIVAIGYDSPLRFAAEDRARDYTPPDDSGAPVTDPRGREGGGAARFHRLLLEEIVPRAEDLAPVDANRRTLWGHSYGGLFVLHAAMQGGGSFAAHVAASPALWWAKGGFLADLQQRLTSGDRPTGAVRIHAGGAERERASRPARADVQDLIRMRDAAPPDAARDLSDAFRDAGIPGGYVEFPGLSHGETFPASLRHTLKNVANTGP